MKESLRQRIKRMDRKTRANLAVAAGSFAAAVLGGQVYAAHQSASMPPERPGYAEPHTLEDDIYLPIINYDKTPTPQATPTPTPSPTATATPLPTEVPAEGCANMRRWIIPTQIQGPFVSPSSEAGTIFNFYVDDIQKYKFLHEPGAPALGKVFVPGEWYDGLKTDCTPEQVEAEYNRNPLTPVAQDQLCDLGITCKATPTPTPSPTPTSVPEVCPDDQVQAQILTKDPNSYHIVEPQPSGIAALIWTDRDIDPPWGTAEIKVWIGPEQPTWYFYDTEATLLYSNTCSWEQMKALFDNKPQNEKFWDELCREGITCEP